MESNGVSSPPARWAEKLKDLTVSPLTRDYPEPSSDDAAKRLFIDANESLTASENVKIALSKLQDLGPPFHLFLTAFVVLISRLTGDEDIALGTNAETDARPFVLRVPIVSSQTFSQLAANLKEASVVHLFLRLQAS